MSLFRKASRLALLFVFVSPLLLAQDGDVEGSKDHPLLTRMSNFLIGEYETNYDRVEMYIADGQEKGIEGEKTYLYYYFDENTGKNNPSPFQVVKNHEAAIKKLGGKTVYTDGETVGTYLIKKGGHETWVSLLVVNSGAVYYLNIVEVAPMEQEITASAIFTKLAETGNVALYINFDTGKATVKAESQPIIDQVAEMLKENPELKVSIEGHTDNTGNAATNKSLSLNRAKSVIDLLIKQGIPASRLKAAGWGQEKPIEQNTTEEGRASNRRVEIVKI